MNFDIIKSVWRDVPPNSFLLIGYLGSLLVQILNLKYYGC